MSETAKEDYTLFNPKRPPERLSTPLALVLEDFEVVERDPRYIVDMKLCKQLMRVLIEALKEHGL